LTCWRDFLLIALLLRDFLFNYAGIQFQSRVCSKGGLTRSVGWGLRVGDCIQEGSRGDLYWDCRYFFLDIGHGRTFIHPILGRGRRRHHRGVAMENQEKYGAWEKKDLACVVGRQSYSKMTLS
jgi:hypothetical protein